MEVSGKGMGAVLRAADRLPEVKAWEEARLQAAVSEAVLRPSHSLASETLSFRFRWLRCQRSGHCLSTVVCCFCWCRSPRRDA